MHMHTDPVAPAPQSISPPDLLGPQMGLGGRLKAKPGRRGLQTPRLQLVRGQPCLYPPNAQWGYGTSLEVSGVASGPVAGDFHPAPLPRANQELQSSSVQCTHFPDLFFPSVPESPGPGPAFPGSCLFLSCPKAEALVPGTPNAIQGE